MKTLLIALALIGFTTIGSYAQTQTNCACKNKAVHKVAVHHKVRHHASSVPEYITVLAELKNTNKVCPPVSESCYTYRKDNIVVEECPAPLYPNGDIQYMGEGTYMGYYPHSSIEAQDEGENTAIAPQHTVINNYKGVAPADGNSCNGCSAW